MSYGGSSNGSGAIHSSSDVALNNPADGQVLGYSAGVSKWENTTLPKVTVGATQPSNMQPGDVWVDSTPLTAADVNADPAGAAIGLQANHPSQLGLNGWNGDPLYATTAFAPVNGTIYLLRVRATTTGPINKLYYYMPAAASGMVSGQNWLGLYDSGQITLGTATLITSVAQDAGWGSTGLRASTISSQTLQTGIDYFIAFLVNASTTPPNMFSGFSGLTIQPNLSGISLRYATHTITGQTTLPATIPGASLVATNALPIMVAF